jgi:ATP-dependent Clp protease ATP-binding subunit ClpA
LKRAIQDKIEDLISEEILQDKIKEDTQYLISVEDEVIKITEPTVKPKTNRGRKKKEVE